MDGNNPVLSSIETKATISGRETVVTVALRADGRLAINGRTARRLGASGGQVRLTTDGERIIAIAADVVFVLQRRAHEAAKVLYNIEAEGRRHDAAP